MGLQISLGAMELERKTDCSRAVALEKITVVFGQTVTGAGQNGFEARGVQRGDTQWGYEVALLTGFEPVLQP